MSVCFGACMQVDLMDHKEVRHFPAKSKWSTCSLGLSNLLVYRQREMCGALVLCMTDFRETVDGARNELCETPTAQTLIKYERNV